jgi:hypothetical protein
MMASMAFLLYLSRTNEKKRILPFPVPSLTGGKFQGKNALFILAEEVSREAYFMKFLQEPGFADGLP